MSKGQLSKSDGFERIYNLYINNKSNKLVCEVLAKLVPPCIIEYIIEGKPGKVKVKSVLDKLKYNMSPTFKANNSDIPSVIIPTNMSWSINLCGHISYRDKLLEWEYTLDDKLFIVLDETRKSKIIRAVLLNSNESPKNWQQQRQDSRKKQEK